jgi:hypothetical protein
MNNQLVSLKMLQKAMPNGKPVTLGKIADRLNAALAPLVAERERVVRLDEHDKWCVECQTAMLDKRFVRCKLGAALEAKQG